MWLYLRCFRSSLRSGVYGGHRSPWMCMFARIGICSFGFCFLFVRYIEERAEKFKNKQKKAWGLYYCPSAIWGPGTAYKVGLTRCLTRNTYLSDIKKNSLQSESVPTSENTSPVIYAMANITPLGYQPPVEFYAPRYDANDNTPPPYRATMYWNPKLQLNQSGKTLINLEGIKPGQPVNVTIQGIASDGKIIDVTKKVQLH